MALSKKLEVLRMMREDRDFDQSPIIHPNGFIQLKMADGRRMHFWHPQIPRQKVSTPIHDHVFDMESEILLGSLYHQEIWVTSDVDGYYMIWQAEPVRDSETTLVSTNERVKANRYPEREFHPGDRYEFAAFSFHLTRDVRPCVTIIEKKGTHEGKPRVLVPAGTKPDNSWTRDEFDRPWIETWMLRVVAECE